MWIQFPLSWYLVILIMKFTEIVFYKFYRFFMSLGTRIREKIILTILTIYWTNFYLKNRSCLLMDQPSSQELPCHGNYFIVSKHHLPPIHPSERIIYEHLVSLLMRKLGKVLRLQSFLTTLLMKHILVARPLLYCCHLGGMSITVDTTFAFSMLPYCTILVEL